MEEQIHKYLSRYYLVEFSDYYYIKSPDSDYIKTHLRDELVEIFGITKDIAKYIIADWARTRIPDAQLCVYWRSSEIQGMRGIGYIQIYTLSYIKKELWRDVFRTGQIQ